MVFHNGAIAEYNATALARLQGTQAETLAAKEHFVAIRRGVQGKIEYLQRKRLLNLYPTLYLPPAWQPAVLEPPALLYKVVAAAAGSFWSVYDGSTEYVIGKTTHTKHGASCWPALWGCFFIYPTLEQAIHTEFPSNSKYKNTAKVLLQVQARGLGYYHPGSDTWAVSQVKPMRILAQMPTSSGQFLEPLADLRRLKGDLALPEARPCLPPPPSTGRKT